ncbi:unnamed protein product [Arabidopsis arenosa]|uniref:Uncharacterized protein n=1 Tax=Arabidopsis arenosa TaxID=38785 RepID=A0A8S1ZYA3_ARAAE|nr:unnamed protein product [Arabidopsis arenosa]
MVTNEMMPSGESNSTASGSWADYLMSPEADSGAITSNDREREISLAPLPPELRIPYPPQISYPPAALPPELRIPYPPQISYPPAALPPLPEPGSQDPVSPPHPLISFYRNIEKAESFFAGNIELAENLDRIKEMQRALEDERDPYRGRELLEIIDWEVRALEGKVARNHAWNMLRNQKVMADRKQHLQRNPYTAGIEMNNRRIAQTKRRDILDRSSP